MDLIELLIGVIIGSIITIIGVVAVEFILQYIKECKDNNRIITSLGMEIAKNLEILSENKRHKNERYREAYIPFDVVAYHNLNISISQKIIKILGKDAIMSAFFGYVQCERFNREYQVISANLYHMEDACFKDIEVNFNKFLKLTKK